MNLLDKLNLGGTRSAIQVSETCMSITRTSLQTGKVHKMELAITPAQWKKYEDGAYIQDALGHLTLDEREFILSGMTPADWSDFVSSIDDEEDPENG